MDKVVMEKRDVMGKDFCVGVHVEDSGCNMLTSLTELRRKEEIG